MKFDDRFPSLKGKWKSVEELSKMDIKFATFLSNYSVLEHCLDKAIVRKAIQKVKFKIPIQRETKKVLPVYIDLLTEELNL